MELGPSNRHHNRTITTVGAYPSSRKSANRTLRPFLGLPQLQLALLALKLTIEPSPFRKLLALKVLSIFIAIVGSKNHIPDQNVQDKAACGTPPSYIAEQPPMDAISLFCSESHLK